MIGAGKSGTSTLAYLLDQHPRVTLSEPKEPDFFTYNWDRGLDWYRAKFDGPPNSTLIDASPSYSMAPLEEKMRRRWIDFGLEDVPEKVYSISPDAKLIYIMRDPVERTYSAYWHNARGGNESRDFSTSIREDPRHLEQGDYQAQLSLWLEYFPLSSFHFVLFEDLESAPELTARECLRFIDLDPEEAALELDSPKNQAYRATWVGRKANRLFARYPSAKSTVTKTLRNTPPVARRMIKRVAAKPGGVPEMASEDREFLIEYFRERNRKLEHLTGLSLDKWQK